MFQKQKMCTENQNTHFVFDNVSPKNVSFLRLLSSWTDHRWQYGTCTLHVVYLRLQTHTQNV